MIKECNQLIRQKDNAYGMSKDLASEKEEIKIKNVMKRYKKWLTLMMS